MNIDSNNNSTVVVIKVILKFKISRYIAMDSTDAPQIIEHIHKSVTYTPNECRWIPCSARFVSLGKSITITIILLTNNNTNLY